MLSQCHTCGADLSEPRGDSPFCPHCGAPQLTLSMDLQVVEQTEPDAGSTVHATPRPQQVDWRMAIRCAAAVALVAGVLSVLAMVIPVLGAATMLWVMSASVIALGLYQKRRPLAWMDAKVGARIGVVVGLCLAPGLAVPLAVAGVIARFGLHTMNTFDAQLADKFQKVIQQAATPIQPEVVAMVNSQEFRAGYILFIIGFLALMLLVLSAVGGAFGGMMRTRRKATV